MFWIIAQNAGTVHIKKVKKPLTGWQDFQVWYGRIALVFSLLAMIYFVLKQKKRLF